MTMTGIDEEQQKKKKLEKHLEKQIGCMAGFLRIFIGSHSTLSSANASPKQTEKDIGSLVVAAAPPVKEVGGTRTFCSKEAPRLSLDSRAVVDDVKGRGGDKTQRHSISTSPVIARLMGLDEDFVPMPKLQRSASESRLSTRDHLPLNSNNLHHSQPNTPRPNAQQFPLKQRTTMMSNKKNTFHDAAEMKHTVSFYQLIEKRLRVSASKKQPKGLLHSQNPYYHQSPPLRSSSSFHRTRNNSPPKTTRNATGHTGGSPRMRRSTDNTKRYNKLEEYREGRRNLVDRNRIADVTAELQPSPVSVLDSSSIYKDDDEYCTSPSPIAKRCIIHYKDQAEAFSEGKSEEDCDFAYVSEVLRACCSCFPEERDIFMLLKKKKKHSLKGKDTSNASRLHRRLVFDTLLEIISRNQRLPPWTAVSRGEVKQLILSEFRRIREWEEAEDLFGVIKKDMAGEEDCEFPVEMGDVVLNIERLVFKDLIGETIRHLASFAPHCNNKLKPLRRKLVFR